VDYNLMIAFARKKFNTSFNSCIVIKVFNRLVYFRTSQSRVQVFVP